MSGLRERAEAVKAADQLAAAKAKVVSEQKAHQATRRELARTQERVSELERLMDRFTAIKPADMKVPKWLAPKKGRTKVHHATPVLMLSDLHLDEVVDLHEMDGMNEYNRDIAHQRIERIIEGTVKLASQYVAGVQFDGIVVALLGDIITGEIHDELAVTNEATVPETITHWVPFLASALRHLADEFGKVHVPCVDGNHDRRYKKVPAKKRATSSNAWIIYNWMADLCRDDERITFSITTSPEQVIDIYSTRFLLTHGDGFTSQGGVGGIYPALMKFLYRKGELYGRSGRPIDYTLMGHWHQLIWGQNFMVNGSPKGHDEFAKSKGFGLERPQQGLFLVTPENGVVQRMPVFGD